MSRPVVATIAVVFLWAMPERLERRTLLDLLHRLRSQAHVVDMHQLSELVSLIAKTAALCAERTSDTVVLETVSDLETLTAQMSNKIWQKISLLPEH